MTMIQTLTMMTLLLVWLAVKKSVCLLHAVWMAQLESGMTREISLGMPVSMCLSVFHRHVSLHVLSVLHIFLFFV